MYWHKALYMKLFVVKPYWYMLTAIRRHVTIMAMLNHAIIWLFYLQYGGEYEYTGYWRNKIFWNTYG
jgi:hypothetical protein